ncbi:hypothetical protein [Microbacterium sp. XT11]|uniref:hypothetical protein n=1 Tax=Microbacterium sp. XT11 TaxID=367477 RepID=UPI000742F6F3|nr:hypothetical protein [Microbacterium sp. XT11]ALX66834.1 hypothetical protein AB663_002289 [Microbacterium sp. XT11]
MPLGFTDGAYNRASGTRDAFGALSDDLVREGYPPMVSRSGDREPEDQLRIWNERMTLTPNGRKVYGKRTWQGKTWYQIHPDTVAPPNTSNHEKRRSNDLRAPYNADTPAARRAKQLAGRHNITREGENFRELWHWTYWGPLGHIDTPAPAGASTPVIVPEEDNTMLFLKISGLGSGLHYVALGLGVFRHFIPTDPYQKIMRIGRTADDWQDLDINELPATLRTWGCDLHIWDWRPSDGGFVVLDPLDGSVRPGNMWSATNVARSQIAQLPKLISTQTRAYEQTLAKTVPYGAA